MEGMSLSFLALTFGFAFEGIVYVVQGSGQLVIRLTGVAPPVLDGLDFRFLFLHFRFPFTKPADIHWDRTLFALHVMELFPVLIPLALDPIGGSVAQLAILEVLRGHIQEFF